MLNIKNDTFQGLRSQRKLYSIPDREARSLAGHSIKHIWQCGKPVRDTALVVPIGWLGLCEMRWNLQGDSVNLNICYALLMMVTVAGEEAAGGSMCIRGATWLSTTSPTVNGSDCFV